MAQQSKPTSVTFIKPWNRYTKGDRAGFDADRAKSLVERKIAVFTKDAPKQGVAADDSGTPSATPEQTDPNADSGKAGAQKTTK